LLNSLCSHEGIVTILACTQYTSMNGWPIGSAHNSNDRQHEIRHDRSFSILDIRAMLFVVSFYMSARTKIKV
jgi:hypothetical protein